MQGLLTDIFERILEDPFTYRDGKFATMFQKLCTLALCTRVVYMKLPLPIRIIIGLPTLFWGLKVFIIYCGFAIWTKLLDNKCRYTYEASENFIQKYFRTQILKSILYFITAYFMFSYYESPLGWLCFIYSVPMLIISVGYVLPIFDKRIYK